MFMVVRRVTSFPQRKIPSGCGWCFYRLDIVETTLLIIDATNVGSTIGYYRKYYNFNGSEVSESSLNTYLGQALVVIPWKPPF